MTVTHRSTRRALVASFSIAIAAALGCRGASTPAGLGTSQLAVSADTITGSGQLAELQQRRAAWVARGIDDYRLQLRIVCFCVGEVRRPVLIEVRRGAIAKVWDLESAKPVPDTDAYRTITGLFDAAIEERSRGGNVSVTYDGKLGFPVRLEIGTIANDAGKVYELGELTQL